MITNKTSVVELTDLVRQISEYSFILVNGSSADEDRETLFLQLRDKVQKAHRLLSRMEATESNVANEDMAATLDEALMVLNANGFFGSIAQVEVTVL